MEDDISLPTIIFKSILATKNASKLSQYLNWFRGGGVPRGGRGRGLVPQGGRGVHRPPVNRVIYAILVGAREPDICQLMIEPPW